MTRPSRVGIYFDSHRRAQPYTTYAAGAGTSTAGGFYSFGAAGSSDRALGGLGSRGAYFGSPATSAVAGWIAVSFENKSGGAFTGFSATWNGEQWRNGGNTTAQTMVFQYGLGTTFVEVTDWITPGGNFDWTSPVASATAAAVNGNTDGLVSGVGGVIDGLTWLPGETLWLRWVEVNDDGNDHGLAIDDFAFRASAPSGAVPDTGTTVWLLALPLIVLGLVRHRRLCGA